MVVTYRARPFATTGEREGIMTEEQSNTSGQAGDESAELVTPEEHAEASEGVEPDEHVSDDSVPDDVEVAARSADMDEPSTTHVKTFVVGPNPYQTGRNPYTEASGYDHEPNKAATRQGAISAGLWPTGDVTFKSAKKHPDGESWILTYAVEVIPAHDAEPGAEHPRVVAEDGDAEGATNYSPAPEASETEPTE